MVHILIPVYCPQSGIYIIYRHRGQYIIYCPETSILAPWEGGIYIIYIRFFQGIYNYMAPQSRIFRPRLSASDEKILGFGAILLDIALKDTVYTCIYARNKVVNIKRCVYFDNLYALILWKSFSFKTFIEYVKKSIYCVFPTHTLCFFVHK